MKKIYRNSMLLDRCIYSKSSEVIIFLVTCKIDCRFCGSFRNQLRGHLQFQIASSFGLMQMYKPTRTLPHFPAVSPSSFPPCPLWSLRLSIAQIPLLRSPLLASLVRVVPLPGRITLTHARMSRKDVQVHRIPRIASPTQSGTGLTNKK